MVHQEINLYSFETETSDCYHTNLIWLKEIILKINFLSFINTYDFVNFERDAYIN